MQQHTGESKSSKSYLCSECYFYSTDGRLVNCDKGYFSSMAIKKVTIFTPIDFDCWEYEVENNRKGN